MSQLGSVPEVVLGIETSCDDTAAAVISNGTLRSSIVFSQDDHAQFGGVVPEVASRIHQRVIVPVVRRALDEAAVSMLDVGAIAVTYGPGLVGSLLVGLGFAKALALARGVPIIGVNHLEAHIYSVFLEERQPPYPFLCLVVSGGHTELVLVEAPFQHRLLGRTRDDAAGEAYDKVAKLLGLGYPGGPEIDRLAAAGDPAYQAFPRASVGEYDFSFSGLKTSVLYFLNRYDQAQRDQLLSEHLADVAAAFQQAIVDMLLERIRRAVRETGVRHVAITGGVSANRALRSAAEVAAASDRFELYVPAPQFCSDNAAMVAMTGYQKILAGRTNSLTLIAEPSLPLVS